MARNNYNYRRRYYNRGRQYYSRARSGYRRARSAGRRAYNRGYVRFYNSRPGFAAYRANQAIGLYNPGAEYLAGAVIGLTSIDNKIPAPLKIIGAALPLRGGIGGKVSRFFRGMLIGDAVSYFTKFQIPVPGIDGANSNIKWG